MSGWIKLHRKLKNWEWYKDSESVHLFVHLVMEANHKEGRWQGVVVERGQLITGRNSLSRKTGISVKAIRTRLKRMEDGGEISIKTASKFSIITICNYEDYQMEDSESGQQRASKGPAKGQQRATNKNVKKKKKNKKETGRALPCVSVSENEEDSSTSNEEKRNRVAVRPTWISSSLWDDLLSYRKEENLKNTPTGLKILINAFLKAIEVGHEPESCVETYIGSGWKTFNVSWMPEVVQGDAQKENTYEGSSEEEWKEGAGQCVDKPLASWLTERC
jgi:hypothetical protein